MIGVGKTAVAHCAGKRGHGTRDGTSRGEEILDELGTTMAAAEPKQVVQHQHLTVAPRAGTDANVG